MCGYDQSQHKWSTLWLPTLRVDILANIRIAWIIKRAKTPAYFASASVTNWKRFHQVKSGSRVERQRGKRLSIQLIFVGGGEFLFSFIKKSFKSLGCHGSTVVEHSTHNPNIEGLYPPPPPGTGRDKMETFSPFVKKNSLSGHWHSGQL
jgi:hypothetical protein